MIRSLILALTLASAASLATAQDATGTLTILEGEARIFRAAERLTAVEGMRLAPGDILETADAAFAQIEFSNRFVIQFGPATRAMLQVARARGRTERVIYVLNGWTKVSNSQTDAPDDAVFDIRTPLFELSAAPGVAVFSGSPAEATIFAERGELQLSERNVRGAPTRIVLKAGQYYERKAGVSGGLLKAAPKAFVEQVPRHFRDSLPLRMEKFRGRDIEPKDAPPFLYADVEHWLKAEPAIRRQFVQRWRVKSREAGFRSALVANLSSHPEWDPILFPEKYLPKDPPKPKDLTPPPVAAPAAQPSVRQ
jgi:hypothetical protein